MKSFLVERVLRIQILFQIIFRIVPFPVSEMEIIFPFFFFSKLEQSETSSTLGSDFPVKSDDTSSSTSAVSNTQPPLSLLIASTGSVKLELNQSASSPSGISSNGAAKVTNKILIDHTKQNNSHSIISPSSTVKSEPGTTIDSSSGYPNTLQSGLLSSPRSAFSRTSKTTTSQGFHHSPNQRSVIKGRLKKAVFY